MAKSRCEDFTLMDFSILRIIRMPKPSMPIQRFIAFHLNKDCISMVDHLQKDPSLLAEISSYIEYQRDFPRTYILTLQVKLMEYYSCLRQFDVCHYIQAQIENSLRVTEKLEFESGCIEAEYRLLQGIQYRNYVPIQNFSLSELFFKQADELLTKELAVDEQSLNKHIFCLNEYFRLLSNYLGLKVNYDNQPEMAEKIIKKIEEFKQANMISVEGYFAIYHYGKGSYFLNMSNYEDAIRSLNTAKEKITQGSVSSPFLAESNLNKVIEEKLSLAQSKVEASKFRTSGPTLFAGDIALQGKVSNTHKGVSY
jgi:tetratricopeptide (TPR) repeat protein